MGVCTSARNTIEFEDVELKTARPVRILIEYKVTTVNFSNTHQPLLLRDMMGLKKFAEKVDPYMHYKGKSPRKKEILRRRRRRKSEDERLLLRKMWELYLLSQRFTDWGQLSTVHDKEKVVETIDLFLKTREEIIVLLNEVSTRSGN